ncbi:pimeloyl-ACP methyl ester carboxylesterase [Saccharothrix tamanrassetensis]|uniref:Pimeloyl-ACP methyl ester carboxylesterase n=1 Tax=Saccharothrix tamanrassetensis TaxID=1051531 RepID=A0A841CAH4_9PSEU|nr:alpha/beta fold hydrolase [Saccharothrix tamanrassetensis]MBB5953943.1 pimeloyl-ACP methyl ester carboxylesterase [Saccharothrix tamanrassetensis]
MTTPAAERTTAVEEHWTRVDGTETRYLAAGDGHPVLLIHGEGSVAEQWYDILRGLAGSYRVIAVDLPGYGYTKPIPDGSVPALASFVGRFVRALGLERPVLIGHSLGGAVAVHAALARPNRVPALVLVSSAGMGRAISPAYIIQAVTPLGDLTRFLVPVLPFGPQLLVASTALTGSCRPWRISAPWWSSQAHAASTPVALETALRSQRSSVGLLGQKKPILGRLPELPMPTLVAWGLRDRQVPFWQGIAARRRLRRGRLALVPCSSHLLPLEAPEDLLKAVRPFLADLDLAHDPSDQDHGPTDRGDLS